VKNLIVEPNKKRILTATITNFALSHPRLLQRASTQELIMVLKTGIKDEAVARQSILAELLKEIGGGQRNE
jgi:hypothetical protein